MATIDDLTGRVRISLGDTVEPFRTSLRGDGRQTDFTLPNRNISSGSLSVFRANPDGTSVNLVLDTDYTIDLINGEIEFVVPPVQDSTTFVEGSSFGIFSDVELSQYISSAVAMHSMDRTVTKRYRNSHGFITYDRVPMSLENLPEQELPLVATLSTIQALWALATDASTDINVQTAEGTSIPRGQRYSQIMDQIEKLTSWYKELSMMMGVGIFAPEVFDLRRVSRQTGRLVPLFVDREYDEYGPPIRRIPPISERDADPDGPASPWWPGPAGY